MNERDACDKIKKESDGNQCVNVSVCVIMNTQAITGRLLALPGWIHNGAHPDPIII